MSKQDFDRFLCEEQQQIETALADSLDGVEYGRLRESMRYSLLAGGKRIRPVVVRAFCRLGGGDPVCAMPAAIAIEMVHTYSLIHDDLPCMDNDDLRRGRPTSHRVFGEAGAVLAGDALLTEAFSQLVKSDLPAQWIMRQVQVLAQGAGVEGMVAGQVLDLQAELTPADADGVLRIQQLKTGALIGAACQLGALAAGGDAALMTAAERYAAHLGLAFQIRDDLLDREGSVQLLGKATGMDQKKSTFLSLYGAEWSRARIRQETGAAVAALASYPEADFLCWLAETLAVREH